MLYLEFGKMKKLTKEQQETINEMMGYIDYEGLSYAITDFLNENRIKDKIKEFDPELVDLFETYNKTINSIEKHLHKNYSDYYE